LKQSISHPPSGKADDHRGFVEVGLALVSQLVFDRSEVEELRKSAPETKETLEMGNPRDPIVPNRWLPEESFPGFRSFMESWWDACARLEHALLRCLCQALNLSDPDILSKKQTRDVCHMSMAYYPSMAVAPLKTRELRRLNAHTDFGQLTLLFQDMVGGLEVHDGQVFRPVVPKQGTVVINVGDMLERQSNGRWKSALHQVVAPRELMQGWKGDESQVNGADMVGDRFSIIFFGSPDPESMVETLPGCEEKGRWNPNMIGEWGDKMTAGEWIQKRLAAEY
jgi:isopenicillin N synthase-like dioxygenase